MNRSMADHDSFELSYASMNWIRFKGSPCRTNAFDGLSAPCRGSPSTLQSSTTCAERQLEISESQPWLASTPFANGSAGSAFQDNGISGNSV